MYYCTPRGDTAFRASTPTEREKSKGGWMRRLSMPVVSNAFSSEAKMAGAIDGKRVSAKALGSLGEAIQVAVSLDDDNWSEGMDFLHVRLTFFCGDSE